MNFPQSYLISPNPNPPTYLAEMPIASLFPLAVTTLAASISLQGKPFPGALDPTLLLRNSLQQGFPVSPTSSKTICVLDHSH